MATKRYRRLAIAVSIGMFIVLLAGAIVTNTESGRGCGDDWPLCNGKFVPAYTLESLIEYSHRLVSGIVGILTLINVIVTVRLFTRNRAFTEPLVYAGLTLFFTVVQAFMGAAAVMWPQSPQVMALHFGISLFAFASTLLQVFWCYRHRDDRPPYNPGTVPNSFFPRVWFVWGYSLIVIYLGAYIRHTKSSGGCLGWPLCNGELVPELSGATGIAFTHRVAAFLLFLLISGMYIHIRRLKGNADKGFEQTAQWSLMLVVFQVFSGALLIATVGNANLYIFTSLIHNVIICGLFGLLADMSIRAWRLRVKRA